MERVDHIVIEKAQAKISSVAKSQMFMIDLNNFMVSVRNQKNKAITLIFQAGRILIQWASFLNIYR